MLPDLLLEPLVRAALHEDLGPAGDITCRAVIPPALTYDAALVARRAGVVSGLRLAGLAFRLVDPGLGVTMLAADGDPVAPGQVLMRVAGAAASILMAERVALNFAGRLSGIATLTAAHVARTRGTRARITCTRKTTPGLRVLEKYAVRCGGGVNHRMFLSDAALVKDNHVVAAGGVAAAFDKVRAMWPGLPVEVEVDSLAQLTEVLDAGADLVLLDNFTPDQMRLAVGIAKEHAAHTGGKRCLLEASGGLTLPDAPAVATTGVDFVAVGALTHSAPVLDIGADLRPIA